jgi:hypothetical protein
MKRESSSPSSPLLFSSSTYLSLYLALVLFSCIAEGAPSRSSSSSFYDFIFLRYTAPSPAPSPLDSPSHLAPAPRADQLVANQVCNCSSGESCCYWRDRPFCCSDSTTCCGSLCCPSDGVCCRSRYLPAAFCIFLILNNKINKNTQISRGTEGWGTEQNVVRSVIMLLVIAVLYCVWGLLGAAHQPRRRLVYVDTPRLTRLD